MHVIDKSGKSQRQVTGSSQASSQPSSQACSQTSSQASSQANSQATSKAVTDKLTGSSQASHRHFIFKSMQVKYKSYASHMQVICKSYASHMQIICKSYASHIASHICVYHVTFSRRLEAKKVFQSCFPLTHKIVQRYTLFKIMRSSFLQLIQRE